VYLQRKNVKLEKQVSKPRGHGDAEELVEAFPTDDGIAALAAGFFSA